MATTVLTLVCFTLLCEGGGVLASRFTGNDAEAFDDADASRIKSCGDCFKDGQLDCLVCEHEGTEPIGVIPLKANPLDEHALIQLVKNHKNVEDKKKHFAFHGQGPHKSLGVSPTGAEMKKVVESEVKKRSTKLRGTANSIKQSLVPLVYTRHALLVTVVEIGTPSQKIRPIVDTGSTNFWAVNSECKDESCESVSHFSAHNSTSFHPFQHQSSFEITFGTGRILGDGGFDTVKVGDLTVDEQAILLVIQEKDPKRNIFKQLHFEGILGLGGDGLSSTPENASLIHNLLEQVGDEDKPKEFSIYSPVVEDGRQPAALMLGGVPSEWFVGKMLLFPVKEWDDEAFYWQIPVKGLTIGDERVCCDGEDGYIIFDSGTAFNSLPHAEFGVLSRLSRNGNCSEKSGYPSLNTKSIWTCL
eukprot:GHVN01071000.1.p1 GENE.GHVN01071000.1~~GHVN01071000.1.p1  ORF type:complete len:475 (-),score=90.07 GHVN01071000.1:396-1640(-)